MSTQKLPRGILEIPKGTNTSGNEKNTNFTNELEKTNKLLAQYVSAVDPMKRLLLRHELEESYFHLTIYNLKESVRQKIEQDMWNNLFKKTICELQARVKSRDKAESMRAQSEISIFLDESVGFYSKFVDTICLLYDVRLPLGMDDEDDDWRGSRTRGFKPSRKLEISPTAEIDIRYILQHCLVHMGDLARYHSLPRLARFQYELAVQLDPRSGHAYNQLAILESSQSSSSNTVTGVAHLVRTALLYEYANTCQNPFPATRINLESLLKHVNEQSVSSLLTSSGYSVEAGVEQHGPGSCVTSVMIGWLHVYANQRMKFNIGRCRQLQLRVVEWVTEFGKWSSECRTNWTTLIGLAAVHSSFIVGGFHPDSQRDSENKLWFGNSLQFIMDLLNGLCRGFVSVSHGYGDNKSGTTEDLLDNPGCVGIVVVLLAMLLTRCRSPHSLSAFPPLGEQCVRFFNSLVPLADASSDSSSSANASEDYSSDINLPTHLPELDYLTGFQPLQLPCKSYSISALSPALTSSSATTITNQESVHVSSTPSLSATARARASFIVSVCRRLSSESSGVLVMFQHSTNTFSAVPPRESPTVSTPVLAPVKKYVKLEPALAPKKPVNVALASMKINNGVPSQRAAVPDESAAKSSMLNEQIARCIQEQIAQDRQQTGPAGTNNGSHRESNDTQTHSGNSASHSSHVISSSSNQVIAPAPGLILSSNLPPDFKSMSQSGSPSSATTSGASLPQSSGHQSSLATSSTQPANNSDHSPPPSSSILDQLVNKTGKNHSYNPNREQFEKDLPPRFANKRSFSHQEMSTGGTMSSSSSVMIGGDMSSRKNGASGFVSMNYWDYSGGNGGSGGDVTGLSQHVPPFDSNLAKKESEIMLPPNVPSAWLTDNTGNVGGSGGSDLQLPPPPLSDGLQFPFSATSLLQHSQQHQQPPPLPHSFTAASANQSSNHQHILHQQMNQFNQNQSSVLGHNDRDLNANALQYLLHSVSGNTTNTPRFRSQTDGLLSAHINFDNSVSYLQQQHNHLQTNTSSRLSSATNSVTPLTQSQKYPTIPPPTQHMLGSNVPQQIVSGGGAPSNQNYETPFQITRPSFFDKPVFSTSNNQSSPFAYSNSMMAQQSHQQQHHQQQQTHSTHHQLMHNNPLLNLLPGFMNEAQR